MLISSTYRDYYDSIKAFGVDKTVVYNRTEERLVLKKGPKMYSSWFSNGSMHATRIIGFCGKLYPLFEKKGKFLIYDKEEALKNLSESFSWYRKDIEQCFSEYLTNPELLKIFIDKKVPVFIYGDYLTGDHNSGKQKELILNPKLKNWKFQSVVEPVTAFQDIFMYISGVIGIPEAPMIKISDKEMAKKRGHDGKYSFKKPPGKRGKKSWR